MTNIPLIGVTCCTKSIKERYGINFQMAPDDYATSVFEMAECFPVLLPSLGGNFTDNHFLLEGIVEKLDGILLTGSSSNVNPDYYGENLKFSEEYFDHMRDSTTIPLVKEALKQGVPILGICRGYQEMNVALGGALYQDMKSQCPSDIDHYKHTAGLENSPFANRHDIKIKEGGELYSIAKKAHNLAETKEEFTDIVSVSSVHNQAIKKVGEGISIEAVAEDGTIEAISVTNARALTLGVQWHPENRWREDGLSRQLFKALGDAAKKRCDERK